MKLLEHLDNLRKAQLQEYFLRWFPSEELLSDRQKLKSRLSEAMSDPQRIRERFDRLARSHQDFIVALLSREAFRGTLSEIRAVPRAQTIENFEIENLVRNLKDEGWIVPETIANNGARSEVFTLPRELAEGLSFTVDVESREACCMLSLRGFLSARNEMPNGIDGRPARERIGELEHAALRDAALLALDDHNGILPLSVWSELRPDPEDQPDSSWRERLERARLGTTGVLSLKSYGLDLEEDCLILFQELVRDDALRLCEQGEIENDKEYSLGVDLLIDIRHFLEMARTEAVEVTREGTVFKKTEEKIADRLLCPQSPPLFEGSAVNHIIQLCKRLRLLNQDDNHLRADRLRRRGWSKKRLPSMLKSVYELYEKETRSKHWSFHQARLRELFLSIVTGDGAAGYFGRSLLDSRPLGEWIPSRPLLTAIAAQYLSELDDLGVSDKVQELKMEEFQHGALSVSLERLARDLTYWLIHRLAVIGFVDLGFKEGKLQGVRLSSLGCRFFRVPLPESSEGQLVVNPDFEILVFPGGKNEAEINYTIGCFADREGSEWVKRYRVNRRSVKRGIISGLKPEGILEFLETNCSNPVPSNVKYSIEEWSEGVEPILKQRVTLLKARSESGATELSKLLEDHGITHERVGEVSIVLRSAAQEKKLAGIQDDLRAAGLFIE